MPASMPASSSPCENLDALLRPPPPPLPLLKWRLSFTFSQSLTSSSPANTRAHKYLDVPIAPHKIQTAFTISHMAKLNFLMLWLWSLSLLVASARGQKTRVGFYLRTCPRVETIVHKTVRSHFRSDPTLAPGLLRMFFHDCFVRGCDASILIDGPSTEKTAGPNRLLRGYDVIDDAKTQLEVACPGVVSCADILALATRDSVVLTSGRGWNVPTGRKDGRVSLASETSNLPGFRDSVDVQKQKFADKGLDIQDLVTLVGGHTIGTSACQFFRYRLYNFTATGDGADPSISPSFLAQLRALCPETGDAATRVMLDNGSPDRFDASFFTNLKNGRGVLESDQKLWADASTKTYVERFSRGSNFNAQFGRSMVKMSNIGVKTGTEGEIRKVCSAVN